MPQLSQKAQQAMEDARQKPLKLDATQKAEAEAAIRSFYAKPAPPPEPEEEEEELTVPPSAPAKAEEEAPAPKQAAQPKPAPQRPLNTAEERAMRLLSELEAATRAQQAQILSGQRLLEPWTHFRLFQCFTLRMARFFLFLFQLLDQTSPIP